MLYFCALYTVFIMMTTFYERNINVLITPFIRSFHQILVDGDASKSFFFF